MWFRRLVFDIRGWFSVHTRLNRRIFVWLGLFCLAGIIIGFVTIFNPLIEPDKIKNSLIDSNLLRATDSSGFGNIIFSRLFEFIIVCAFLFIIGLNTYTSLLALAYCTLRACMIVINMYWIIANFGLISGIVLALVYAFFLILLLITYIFLIIFMLKHCACIRRNGFRYGTKWSEFWHTLFAFALVIGIIAILEWIIYWLILSKFIFLT